MKFHILILTVLLGYAATSPTPINDDLQNREFELRAPEPQLPGPLGPKPPLPSPKIPKVPGIPKPTGPRPTRPIPPNTKCPNRQNTVPLLRLPAGKFSNFSRVIAYIFPTRVPDRMVVALYSAYSRRANDYIYTIHIRALTAAARRGYKSRGVVGYVYRYPQHCDGVPLFELFNRKKNEHFYTTSTSDKRELMKQGYTDSGIIAYVYDFKPLDLPAP